MNWKRLLSKIRASRYIIEGYGKPSYSQVGEDRILHYFFATLGIEHPRYLDIGANDPMLGSNTYFFYQRGASGVLVEPEPGLFQKLKRTRPRDISLNVGIGLGENTDAEFYVFPHPYSGWNTFSREEAEQRKREGHPYSKVLRLPLRNVNDIIRDSLGAAPDFISIDVEGLDLDILRSLDFAQYGPKAIVVETLRFGDSQNAGKDHSILEFMQGKGYVVYGDTFVNTIFVKNSV